jgi:hypothetical protein
VEQESTYFSEWSIKKNRLNQNTRKEMLRILILFLSFAISSFASEWYEGEMFVYGDVEYISNIFNAIAMVIQHDVTMSIAGLALSYSMALNGWRYINSTFKNSDLMKHTAFAMSAFVFIIQPSSTIHIHDQRVVNGVIIGEPGVTSSAYSKVDNLPFLVVFIADGATKLSVGLDEIITAAFSPVDAPTDFAMNKIGFMSQYETMNKIVKAAIDLDPQDTEMKSFRRNLDIYMSECVIGYAIANDYTKKANLTNPDGDLFSKITPNVLGITGASYNFYDSLTDSDTTCDNFWNTNFDIDNYKEKLFTLLNDSFADIDLEKFGASASMGLMATTEGIASSSIADFKTTVLNLGTTRQVQTAITNASQGAGLSGQDLANSITLGSSLAQIQSEGIGQFKWLTETFPMFLHFMRGILYAAFILMAFTILFRPYEEAMNSFKTYAISMVGFEMMTVVLSMVQGTVNIYAQHQAADLVVMYGKNLHTMNNIPAYLEYLSTMSGLAGILGVAAFFMIPTLVMTGNAMGAMGAMQGLMGKYKGNDIDTALANTTTQAGVHSTQAAMMDKKANGTFDGDIISGAGESERISALIKSAQGTAAVQGASSIASDMKNMKDYASGTFNNATAQNAGIMGAGQTNLSAGQIATGASASGQVQLESSTMKGLALHEMGAAGSDAHMQGVMNSSITEAASTMQMANMTKGQAIASGKQAAQSKINQAQALIDSEAYNQHGNADEEFAVLQKGETRNARTKLNQSMGLGRSTYKDANGNDIDDKQHFTNIEKQAAANAQMDSIKAAIMASHTNKSGANADGSFNSTTGVNLNKDLAQATIGAENTKLDSMIATTQGYGGASAQAKYGADGARAKAGADKSMQDLMNNRYEDGGYIGQSIQAAKLKAAKDIGTTQRETNKNDGQKIGNALDDLAAKELDPAQKLATQNLANQFKNGKDIFDSIITGEMNTKSTTEVFETGAGTVQISQDAQGNTRGTMSNSAVKYSNGTSHDVNNAMSFKNTDSYTKKAVQNATDASGNIDTNEVNDILKSFNAMKDGMDLKSQAAFLASQGLNSDEISEFLTNSAGISPLGAAELVGAAATGGLAYGVGKKLRANAGQNTKNDGDLDNLDTSKMSIDEKVKSGHYDNLSKQAEAERQQGRIVGFVTESSQPHQRASNFTVDAPKGRMGGVVAGIGILAAGASQSFADAIDTVANMADNFGTPFTPTGLGAGSDLPRGGGVYGPPNMNVQVPNPVQDTAPSFGGGGNSNMETNSKLDGIEAQLGELSSKLK